MQHSPYMSSQTKEHRMPYVQKDVYCRLPSYSSSPLRLPPPTPTSRYISAPQIYDTDVCSDDSDSHGIRKQVSLGMFYSSPKVCSLSATTRIPMPLSRIGHTLTCSLRFNQGAPGVLLPPNATGALSLASVAHHHLSSLAHATRGGYPYHHMQTERASSVLRYP